MILGIISDTHGLLRPEAVAKLQGVDHIIHAGDVGKGEIISTLEDIAPVTVVRGNVDPPGAWPDRAEVTIKGVRFFITHRIEDVSTSDRATDVIVVGHSHKPRIEQHGSVLELNPGSAGPKRFALPITLATVTFATGTPRFEIHTLVR